MFTPNLAFGMVNVPVIVSQLHSRAIWRDGLIAGGREWVQPTVGGAIPGWVVLGYLRKRSELATRRKRVGGVFFQGKPWLLFESLSQLPSLTGCDRNYKPTKPFPSPKLLWVMVFITAIESKLGQSVQLVFIDAGSVSP